jgi:hypothetical protein
MLSVGAIIIFHDRDQARQLPGNVDWPYLGIALGPVGACYLFEGISVVIILSVFDHTVAI